MSFLPCALQLDGEAREPLELHAFDGKHFRLVGAHAKAPGQPLTVVAQLDPPLSLDLKSIGSVRRPDGRFDVRARAATLTRDARAALLAFFAKP